MKAEFSRIKDGRLSINLVAETLDEENKLCEFELECEKNKQLANKVKSYAGYVNVRLNGVCASNNGVDCLSIEQPFKKR
jgi:hypothetical protein